MKRHRDDLGRLLLRRFNSMRIIQDQFPSAIQLLSDDIGVGPRPNPDITGRRLHP
jgi:hypothetical protein